MNKKIIVHFQTVDPILSSIIPKVKPFTVQKSNNYFSDLVETIICQQLSDKAGGTIFGRFCALFPKGKFTPEQILKLSDKKIRAVGPSWSKVGYIKNIARFVYQKQLNLMGLDAFDDEKVIRELTKIKGIGRWTAEMFLIFSLGREDIFSFGDLGLRRAVQRLYKLKSEPTVKQLMKISQKWSPYRTYACRILWKSLEIMI